MKIRNILVIFAVAALMMGCHHQPAAVVTGTVEGRSGDSLVLMYLAFNTLEPVDTLVTDAQGAFRCKVALPSGLPEFYYLYEGQTQRAAVVLHHGDRVNVSIKDGDYSVEGSDDSQFLYDANASFAAARGEMLSLTEDYLGASSSSLQKDIRTRMGRVFVDYKRTAIAQMMEHPKSIVSAILPFRQFSDELPVFTEHTDVLFLRQICDSLLATYPSSPYVRALNDDVKSRTNLFELSQKMEQAETVGFPDLVLPDVNGEEQRLSLLKGNVIILSFWSAGHPDHKMYNHNLMDLYAKYHSRGLEIYQVSLDPDKPMWASAVRTQELPWISVNDGLGSLSPARTAYNILQVPTLFVISRGGEVVSRNVVEPAELEKIIQKCL